jgi:UDP-N-acetylglucosamine 2-epimerase (non-hydrolysing)
MKILSVVGARPNFMKIAPFIRAIEAHNEESGERRAKSPEQRAESGEREDLAVGTPPPTLEDQKAESKEQRAESEERKAKSGKRKQEDSSQLSAFSSQLHIEHILVHTGQHYDVRMSQGFFDELNIPAPDYNLEVGSGSHAYQVGTTMIEFEKVLLEERPDWVVVVGDVNATCACSITAKKHGVRVAHIEAGLRSFDMSMPEEINRLVTDRISNVLFTTDAIACQNLRNEGVEDDRIRLVGNIMIDTLEAERHKAAALDIDTIVSENLLTDGPDLAKRCGSLVRRPEAASHSSEPSRRQVADYAIMTMHRPSNVDEKAVLEPIIDFLCGEVAAELPLLWPIHPRTRKQLETLGLWERVSECNGLVLLHPLGYHDLLRLNMSACIMLTDSGGLQEECCVLGTPCLTLRENTERPVTLREHGGASVLVGNRIDCIREEFRRTLAIDRTPTRPPLWDGHAAERILRGLMPPNCPAGCPL